MTYPDLDDLPLDELAEEVRLRATIYEGHKIDARFSKQSWDRRKASEKADLAYWNLCDAVTVYSRRIGMCN